MVKFVSYWASGMQSFCSMLLSLCVTCRNTLPFGTPVRGSPAACGPKLAKYFNAKLWRADGDFRGDADAAAAVLALVVAFCEEVLMLEESLKPYIESTQCLQKLVCCIWACTVSQLQSTWIRCKRNILKHMIKHGRKKPCDPNGTTDYTCKLKSRGATKC